MGLKASRQPGHERTASARNAGSARPLPQRLPPVQARQGCACGGGCRSCRTSADRFEVETGAAADRVTAGRAPPAPGRTEPEPTREPDPTAGTPAPDAALAPAAAPALGAGQPLDPDLAAFFGARFGRDFGTVRLHRDATAARAARGLGARAYAHGRDIAFAAGEYRPDSHDGLQLLAHELTHVAQQGHAPPAGHAADVTDAPDNLQRRMCEVPDPGRIATGSADSGAPSHPDVARDTTGQRTQEMAPRPAAGPPPQGLAPDTRSRATRDMPTSPGPAGGPLEPMPMIGSHLRHRAPPLIRVPAPRQPRLAPDPARSPEACACGGGCGECQAGGGGAEAEREADTVAAAVLAGSGRAAAPVAVAAPGGPTLQRAPDPSVERGRSVFVDEAIGSLERGATMVAEAAYPVDRARFDRLMDGWLATMIKTERIIDAGPPEIAARKDDLRAAYKAALGALVARWSRESGESEADLYRANSGRIPLWAWPEPHRLEAGFSTPLAAGTAVDPRSGEATLTLNGIAVRLLPDGVDATLKPGGAETRGGFPTRFMPGATQHDGRITRVAPTPQQVITIQTFYGPGAHAAGPSGYGRGRTPEDIAGSAVLPRSRTLGFHEGEHGLAMLEFIRSHPPPEFHGRVGMTIAAFRAEEVAFNGRLDDYQKAMLRFTEQQVDCAGPVTIDDHKRAGAAQGTVVAITCGP